MKIGYINTNNKSIAKDTLIRNLIRLEMQYVEMEDEVLIECDYLIRFVEKEDVFDSLNLIEILNNPCSFKEFSLDTEVSSLGINSDFPRLRKNNYKRESRRVNTLVKTKQYSNVRRRYK